MCLSIVFDLDNLTAEWHRYHVTRTKTGLTVVDQIPDLDWGVVL